MTSVCWQEIESPIRTGRTTLTHTPLNIVALCRQCNQSRDGVFVSLFVCLLSCSLRTGLHIIPQTQSSTKRKTPGTLWNVAESQTLSDESVSYGGRFPWRQGGAVLGGTRVWSDSDKTCIRRQVEGASLCCSVITCCWRVRAAAACRCTVICQIKRRKKRLCF